MAHKLPRGKIPNIAVDARTLVGPPEVKRSTTDSATGDTDSLEFTATSRTNCAS
jgi:hypothetical protein